MAAETFILIAWHKPGALWAHTSGVCYGILEESKSKVVFIQSFIGHKALAKSTIISIANDIHTNVSIHFQITRAEVHKIKFIFIPQPAHSSSRTFPCYYIADQSFQAYSNHMPPYPKVGRKAALAICESYSSRRRVLDPAHREEADDTCEGREWV
jgi:hypothetical protein